MVTIIDCGMGNLRSVEKAFEHLHHSACVTADPDKVRHADRLVLPGDGAFGDEMKYLKQLDLEPAIREFVKMGKPFLGICVGQQVLFEEGEEFGTHSGFGLLKGKIKRLPDGLPVPHMGWNKVHLKKEDPILSGVPPECFVYFIHSYYIAEFLKEDVIATTDYGFEFPVVMGKENIFSVQFHPEKSQQPGLRMLENFAQL